MRDMRRFTRNDGILISVLLVVCIAVCLLFYLGRTEGGVVVVTVDGEEYGRYSLSEERRVEITDADGQVTNLLEIREGEVWMQEADCPDKLCMHQRAIRREGENIVCLPNRVVATVEQANESGLDGFAQ